MRVWFPSPILSDGQNLFKVRQVWQSDRFFREGERDIISKMASGATSQQADCKMVLFFSEPDKRLVDDLETSCPEQLVAQRDPAHDQPAMHDLYPIGARAVIKKMAIRREYCAVATRGNVVGPRARDGPRGAD